MAIKIQGNTIIDDGRNIINAGITTVTSVSIGNTQVISSGRQLQNIASLDAVTTATIESSISNTSKTFSNLAVTGISTLGVTSLTNLTAQQLNVTGVVTATTFIGNLTGTVSFATSAGIATYASTAGIATYATTAGIATALQNSRTFEITGDIIASPISFDGTGNVSLAATIQPNSVALGGDTTGDYVQSIAGTSNQITVTSGTGESSTPTLSIPSQFTAPQDVTVTRDLQVNRNLNVNGNITIGGTSATLFTTEFKVYDPDIVLGFRTDAFGNDISTDNTANHGGIAVASTEGTPLISLYDVGIGETNPATYKKIMWFKSGTFSGLGTDAWISNYAIGIGSTQVPNGVRLAAGGMQVTDRTLSIPQLNVSGVSTSSGGFVGNLTGTATTATNLSDAANITTGTINSARLSGTYNINVSYASTAGIATVAQGLTGTPSIVVGIVTATSFVKSGGTSSQFLKADGSVDTSTYATQSYVGLATVGLASVSYVDSKVGLATVGLLASTGNGSNLTGIVTSIVAGTNVTISGSTGQVTINASGGGVNYWNQTTVGIHTLSNVGIGTTNPTENLSVLGKIQVHQDSSSNNRLIFRGQPGSSYRWNIDNYSSSNEFRIFREDDATSANGFAPFSISTTGTLTATKFSGDGSLLTGIVASGSGVVVQNQGSNVGTAGTLNFSTNLTASFSSGTATISLSNNPSISGILTADQVYTSNNGNGTNIRIGDDLWIGDINLANTIRLSGAQDSTKAFVVFGSSDAVALGRTGTGSLYYGGNFDIAGVVTATSYRGSGTNLTGIVTSIVAGTNVTISGSTGQVTINATGGGGSLGIATAGGTVGTAVTLFDFRGPGISTVTVSSGIGTINIIGGGGSSTPDISPVMMGMIF